MITLNEACRLLLSDMPIFSFIGSVQETDTLYIISGLDRNGGAMLIPAFSVDKATGSVQPCTVDFMIKTERRNLNVPEEFAYKRP